MKNILPLAGVVLALHGGVAHAVPEASFSATSGKLTVPGVVIDASTAYDVVMSLSNASTYEFTLSTATAAASVGGSGYSASSGKVTIPSLTLDSNGKTTRYAVELSLVAGSNPLRFKLASATANSTTYSESTEAGKVAAWVKALEPVSNEKNRQALFAPDNLTNSDPTQADYMSKNGPVAFFGNSTMMDAAKAKWKSRIERYGPMAQAGGFNAVRHPLLLPWGMVEISKGNYDYTLSDYLIGKYGEYGIDYVPVISPFADWDLANKTKTASNSTSCSNFLTTEFTFLAKNGIMDKPVDLDAFATWVGKIAERYDGDGKDDMSGLKRPIKYFQIQNEPETNSTCGGYFGDEAGFVELMKRAYTAIKAACPTCKVMNGGATEFESNKAQSKFWGTAGGLGLGNYLDIIAMHYNSGKHDSNYGSEAQFETWIATIKSALGSSKPIWVTEYGVLVNIPAGGSFVPITETGAAAWFMRMNTVGMANGVEKFFADIDPFVIIQGTGGATIVQLPYYTVRMMNALLADASAVTKIAAGQYRYTQTGKTTYVLWTGVPTELTGTVTYYDMYGTEKTGSASSLSPTEASPLIVVKK